ncbi:hypothetical protein ACP70R_040267 [Stipagrostis hirtigluma subsp. patula]
MALVPRGCWVFLALVVAALAVSAVEGHNHGARSAAAPSPAASYPPGGRAPAPSSGGPATGTASPPGAEAPAPSPAAAEHSEGAAVEAFAWPAALLGAAGVAAVMMA